MLHSETSLVKFMYVVLCENTFSVVYACSSKNWYQIFYNRFQFLNQEMNRFFKNAFILRHFAFFQESLFENWKHELMENRKNKMFGYFWRKSMHFIHRK